MRHREHRSSDEEGRPACPHGALCGIRARGQNMQQKCRIGGHVDCRMHLLLRYTPPGASRCTRRLSHTKGRQLAPPAHTRGANLPPSSPGGRTAAGPPQPKLQLKAARRQGGCVWCITCISYCHVCTSHNHCEHTHLAFCMLFFFESHFFMQASQNLSPIVLIPVKAVSGIFLRKPD